MKKYIYSLFIVFFCHSLSLSAFAQSDNRGTDFWVCFPQNAAFESAGLVFKLYITGDQASTGTVTGAGSSFPLHFSLKPGEVISVDIDTILQVFGSDQVSALGVHVVSDNPVAVYGLSNRRASTDTYVALPTNVLGLSYRAMGYERLGYDDKFTSQITFIATDDNTTAKITLTGNTRGGRKTGEIYSVTLNKGEVYQLQGASGADGKSDLTGTLVTTDKPIAFFTGHTCAQVPANINFCDMLLEEVPPINSWGKQFFVSKMLGKGWYVVRVVAHENDTKIFFNEKFIKTLAAGEFYEAQHVKDNLMIVSDKPILVGQYATGSEADSVKVGDPFLMLISPSEQFLQSYRFVTPVKGVWHHYINIIVPTASVNALRLDGNPISSSIFKPIGITRFCVGQYEIGYGSHTISADRPFGLYSYGFGVASDNYDSYGNIAGQRVAPIERVADTSKPTLELAQSDTATDVVLIARDDRINDLGLSQIIVTDSSNSSTPVFYPFFDQGAPLVKFNINKVTQTNCIYVKLQDFAKNQSNYVLCPIPPTSSNETANQSARYSITPILVEQQQPHEYYPVDVYPSPAKYGQPVTINYTNAQPEIIAVQVFDEGSNLVDELQKRQMTGAGPHTLTYLSGQYATGTYFLRLLAYLQNGQVVYQQDARFIVIK
jgi:hypothetical protein